MTRFPDWTASEVVTATKLDQVSVDYVPKTADEDLNLSTTLQNDNHLAYAINATGTYVIDLFLLARSAANAAGHINLAFTFPAATAYWWGPGPDATLASGSIQTTQWVGVAPYTSGGGINYGLSTTVIGMHIHLLLIATATGTLQLQWAQVASNANNTTVKAGSHMIVRQVA